MGSLRCAIGCWLALFLGTLVAQAAPETRLLDPPTGEILQRDVLLWWEGIPEGPDAPIIGYRLRVDGQEQFTTALYQALFGLTPGEHTVEVAAFDARGEVDPTPATARFIVLEAEAFEEELNNTEETANVLALLTTITGISDVGGGPDRYRLTLPPGADRLAVMVRFREAVSPETTPIQITVQRGTVILVEEEIGGASGPRQLSAVVDVGVGPAVYAVEIAPNFDNIFLSARYALTVQPLTFSPQAYADLEPNGTPAQAREVRLPEGQPIVTLFGTSDAPGDTDYFRLILEAPQPRWLGVELSRLGDSGTTTAELFAGRQPLVSRQVGRLNAAPENAQFDWTEAGLAPGEVLIRIRSEEASGVPYVLRFRVLDVPVPAVPEVEPNSPDLALRPTTLQALQPGVPILGTHWSADDLDRFQVTVPQSGVLSLTLERDGAVGRTRLRLLSEMLQLLGELTTAPERPTDTLRAVATPGVYYVELVPEGEVSPREGYRLSAALEVPGVLEASHDATRPLRRGERLTVRATAPPGMRAELLLGPDGRTVPLYDDGTHGDPTAGDGSYLGTYTVSAQDQFFDLSLAVRVVAPDGSESVLTLAPPVTLDGVPPAPVSGLVASDTPGDEGLSLEARWDPSPAVDLADYWVYLSPEPIGSVAGLQPVVTTSRTQTSVPVPEAEREWFLAVVAVDRAGNPSGLGTQSTAGPVVAADNRPPQPVRGVQLLDRPWDLGGTLLARWQPVVVPDFSTYRLYLDVEPIATTVGRSPVVELPYSFWTVADLSGLDPAQEYFLAVTAVDRAGNESALGSESVAGPIAPRPELAESPAVNGLYLPTGTVRTGRVPIAWDLFQHGGVVRLRLDGGPARALEGGWALLEGLQPGDHRVELLDSGGTVRASAQIAVAPEALVPPQDISSPVPLESGLPWTVFKTGRFLWRGSGAGGVVFLLEALEGSFTAQLLRDGSMIGTAPVEAGQAATLWASDDDSELLLSGEGRLTLVGFRLPGLSFEREPNETTSGRFLLGESPEVRFGQAEGQDTYRWSLDETSDLLLEAVSGSGRTEILWRLIQEPDLLVAEWVGEGGALGRRRELRLRAGTYRLEASALASSSTFYGLRVSRGTPSGTREVEPNDRSGQETDLLLDRPAVGALDKPRDLDRYRLTVGRQGYLLVRVEPIVGNAELSAGIIALDGTPLAEARSAEPIDLQALLSGASVRLLLQGEGGEGSYRVAATLVPGLEAQGRSTLRAGESVTVRVTWSPGRQVEALWAGEDGTPLSGPAPLSETRSGQYEGSLQVAEGLDGERRRVLLRLRDGELSYRLLSPTGYRIDTVPPQIQEAAHNAQQAPLGLGATLTVQVRAEPGLSGTFDLLTAEGVAFRAALPLPEEEAGLYVGRYPVDESSFLENGRVQVLLRDTAENETRLTLPEPVTLDVTPPVVESVGHDGTALLTEGTRLLVRLTGERGATGSFFLLTEEGEIFRGPLPLFDDGRHADGEAGDGHYAGSYTVRPGDFLRSGRVQAELRDLAGNRTAVEAALPVRVDAAPARIEEVVHDATRPLRAGERLLVTVRGSLEATAFFRLIAPDGSVYRDNLPMSDDGTLDETPGDGVYAGFYEVAEGDQLYGGRVEVVLRKPTGTEARRSASVPIAVDAVSPAPIQGVQAEDLPGDEGGFLRLRWEPTTAPDFVRYEVYLSELAIVSVEGMTPLPRSLLNRQETEALLEAPSDRPVFVAVVAVDRAGNRSPIQLGAGGSVAGPVQALDNLPPSPIEGVLAFDRPNDDGGTITVRWSPSPAADFAEYRVYLSVQPFSEGPVPAEVPPVAVSPARSLTLLDVPAPADGTDLYVAVTARDQTGNESALGPASHFGPVQSFADLPALADAPFSFLIAPVGVVRGSAAFFRWSRTWEGEPVEVFRYRLDGGNARSTRSPEVLLSGLQPGEHVFQVEPAADPSRRLVQRFQVEPLWVPEQEPNEDPVTAQSIAPTVPVRGSLRDSADLDRFRLELLSEGILTVILERQAPGTAYVEVVPVLGSATGEPITRTTVIGLERSLNAVSVGLSAGTYLLQVTGDQGPYQLTVRLSPNHPRFSLEVEPNDRSIEATPFGEGTVELSGSGNRPDDRDWFRLPVRDPSVAWELVLLQPLASGSSAVTVWTELPNGERQLFTTATLGPQLSTFRVQSGFQTAALWVEVIPAQEAPYTLLWRPAQDGVPRELEPNDDPSRPTVLNGGERELLGVANRPGDRDWFRLLVPDRETSWELAVQQPLSSGAGTVALWIEAPDGTRLPLAEATLNPEQPTARFRARFQTEALWAEVVPAPEVPYTLSWRPVVDGTIWEREPNDDPTRAVSLSSAEWTYGAISREGDSDLFRLDPSGPASGIGLLSIERIRGEPPTVELQDAFRRPIPFEPVLTTDGLQSGVVWPLAGSLLVRVSAPAGSEYRIGAVRVPDAHHTAERPLGQGESFTVRVAVPADWTVRAELSAARRTVPMSFQDGLWQGTYTVREGDWTQGEPVLLSLEAPSGWRGLLPVGPPVVLDTLPPTILSAEHSAVRALRAGEELRIVVRSEPGLIGRFELQEGNFLVSGVLLDDGAHEDGNPDDGLYVGVYRVQPGDRAEAARVTVLLEDAVGNRAQRELPRPVRLDTTPPLIESVQHNGVEVLTPGARLIVTVRGEPGAQAFFSVPGLRSEVPLYDTGAQDDEVAGDGVYVGATQITPSDPTITELVHVRLTDSAGNVAEAVSSLPVAVDTQGPAIQSVTHNGDRPLRLGERLVVRVVSEPDGTATFDLGTERLQLPLFDDGTGEDETADDGVYTGVYVVQEGDQLTEVPLTVRVRDAYGNETIATAQRRVTLDAIPPPPVLGLKVEDVPNDEGNRLRLSWQPIQEVRDFLRYHVYRERFPIRSVQGLAPVHSELVRPEAATLELEVPSNNVDYYFAITAVDQARNESPLDPSGGSVFGPVRAVDDIPPAPVAGVKAEDVPGDNGRALRVSWTTQNTEPDFAGYRIFVFPAPPEEAQLREQAPAEVVSDRTQTQALVSVARDEVPYYVAVVAADANGNYSALAETSVFGPVRSVDNVPPDPVQGVRADDAPADRGGRLRVRWTPNEDPTVREYRLYVLVRVPQSEADLNRALAAVAVEWEEGSLPETLVPSEGDGLDRYVAVVAVDGSGNRSALDAGSVAGPVRSVVNVLEAMGPVRVGAGFDRQSSVFVPAAAVVPGMRIDILPVEEPLLRSVQEANQNLAEAHIDPETEELLLDTVRWVDSNQERFRVPLTLTLGYPIQIEGEVLQDLRLFRLNDRVQPARWELVPGTHTRNELDRTLSAPIETPGVYRLARLLLPRLLDQVVVYPNPFRIQQDGVVIFRNLTREARIEIFTLDGRRVKRIPPNGSGSATWDGRNENGDPVASGLYLFLIVAPTDRRTGQLFVVR